MAHVIVVLDVDEGEVEEVVGPFSTRKKAEEVVEPVKEAYREHDRFTQYLVAIKEVTDPEDAGHF